MNLNALIKQKIVIVDGGMGTCLQALGLKGGEKPEEWNLLYPERVQAIHADYVRAGADIVTANTFGANRLHFPDQLDEVICAAIANAKASGAFVAMDLGPTGRLLKPNGDLPFEEAVALFKEAAAIGAKAGADLFIIETMSDSYEMKAAVLGAKEAAALPVIATFTLSESGTLLTGGDIEGCVALLESLRVDALGLNCGFGPDTMKPLIERVLACASIPVLLSPNAGLPEVMDGHTHFNVAPKDFAEQMLPLIASGLSLAGGCCGTTPEHIKAMADLAKTVSPKPITQKHITAVSSGSQTVTFEKGCVVIGERINPTGKKRLQQALRDNDMDYLLQEAVTQMQLGAAILDVNVGLPGIDEKAWLLNAVTALQSVCPLPLQLDTADADALRGAMRIYNGKPLINSVSGKQASMDQVFPLMQKYGGTVVALTLDESGIPDTADGRLEIAKNILNEAQKYGIAPKDILFDGLVMTVSTNAQAAMTTLETVRRLKAELGAHTILGVSNVSFGLPERGQLNAAFLAMAIQNGLSAAIMNPQSTLMMASLKSANALIGADDGFADYIDAYANQATVNATPKAQMSLYDSVLSGLERNAGLATEQMLSKGDKPLDIIEATLVPALDEVGRRYESGKSYLPQLLKSADAAKVAFGVIQSAMAASGEETQKGGKLALATVQGDIHDIGKNIVKVMLQNYGFEVIDLGKDVAPEKVLEAVRENDLKLVGLSALMTTTVPSMEKTIALLNEKAPQTKVMVGGAVLNADYANKIGADRYCKDAIASVQFAKEILK